MLSLLRTRRWQAFTAAALVAIIAFGLLSYWQYNRAEEERQEFATISAQMTADPTVLPQQASGAEVDWRHVELTGEYDPDAQLLIRNRPQDGRNGYWVTTLLRTDLGAVWVVRGWYPAQVAAGSETVAPAPPTGTVVVDGYARTPDGEPARRADDIPAGQATAVNPTGLSEIVAAPAPAAWYVIATNDPQLAAVPPPEATDSRNLSYAGQWLLFAAVVIGGWFFFLRREAAETAAAEPERTPTTTG